MPARSPLPRPLPPEPLDVYFPPTRSTHITLLTEILVSKKKAEEAANLALEPLRELGRRRLEALGIDNLDLIPEGSGRAVTPDCPPVSRGSDETVELQDPYEFWAKEADFVIAIFAQALAD
jgi:hypothetical protein